MGRDVDHGRRALRDPGALATLLTALLVVPCGSVAVLFALEIDVVSHPVPRRLIAAGLALLAPVGLLAVCWVSGRFAGARRWPSLVFGTVWLLAAVGLVAVPLAARMGLGKTPVRRGSGGLRDFHLPTASEIQTAIVIGVAVAFVFLMVGVFASWFGPRGTVAGAGLAVGVGLASVPLSFYAIALSYDVPVSAGDDPLADTAQTLAIVWLVAAPLAGLLSGLTLAGGGIRRRVPTANPTIAGPRSPGTEPSVGLYRR